MKRLFETGCCPRQSFERFPAWVQPLITAVSGKAGRGERPWLQVGPVFAIVFDLGKLTAGVGLGAAAASAGGGWLATLPVCWLLTVNALRSLTSDAHYAGHGCVTGNRVIDHMLGEVLSTLVLSANMTAYARGHNTRHHGAVGIGTLADPDIGLMHLMGFRTGRPVPWYWRRLWLSLFSPRYHLLYMWNRLRWNFGSQPLLRTAFAWLVHGTVIALVCRYGGWGAWALAWAIPAIPLVAISAALQFPSEHLWLTPRRPGETGREYLRRISYGRFFLVSAPRDGLPLPEKLLAWSYWCLAMIRPLCERLFVCASVLPVHDYHHRRPQMLDWPMEPYARQRDIESGVTDYQEWFGLAPAYSAQFVVWSQLYPDAIDPSFTTLGFVEWAMGRRDQRARRTQSIASDTTGKASR